MFRRIFAISGVPEQYRSNFLHFYFDIAWFGVLSGSAASFLGVYLTRLGAAGMQLGLLSATGAAVGLLMAIPAGRWLEGRPISKAVFWTSIGQRFFYLLWIPLPWLFGAQGQIWAMISFALLMAVPATALGVGFNTLFAAAVPPEWRAPVAGIRNVMLSVTFIASSLGSGYILDRVAFPAGYQIVFAIGAFGALMSSLHLYFVRPLPAADAPAPDRKPAPARQPSRRRGWRAAIRADIWKTPFGAILLVMLFFTLAQYLALPLFPIYFVRNLGLTDAQIGIGTAIFYLAHLIGSTQLARLTRKLGHHKITAYGSMAMCLYPIILGLSNGPAAYYFLQTIGGLVFSMVGGAQANYLLENIPANDRPAYLAWYTVIANASILAGSLAGPLLSDWMGISLALIVFGALRLLGGWAILKWGRGKEVTIYD
ncbi:MAG: putative major facilitator superfamily transporter [Anaerolineaceae bacterium]|nr:MAG: putative major facilitator superfamily transporter [Anaerolineaceae bacterium]